mgnify:CR=1 FL=1
MLSNVGKDICSFYNLYRAMLLCKRGVIWKFLPNDRYLLENEKFRLYYTAEGDEAHNFIVVVEDNFKNSYELEFDFNNRNIKDDGLTAISIGNFRPLLK